MTAFRAFCWVPYPLRTGEPSKNGSFRALRRVKSNSEGRLREEGLAQHRKALNVLSFTYNETYLQYQAFPTKERCVLEDDAQL